MKAVIFDIDGTLANCAHRLHHVRGGKKNWPAFFEALGEDTPNEPIRWLAKQITDVDVALLIVSGRPSEYRPQTEAWLERYGIEYDEFYMRGEGDYRHDYIVKGQILDGIIADGYEPFLVVDDRQSVVDMWRERGIMTLQCAPSDQRQNTPANAMLTLMVGPSGAGKSTWLSGSDARQNDIMPAHVISSDDFHDDVVVMVPVH